MILRQKERGTDAGPRQGVSPPLFPVKKGQFSLSFSSFVLVRVPLIMGFLRLEKKGS